MPIEIIDPVEEAPKEPVAEPEVVIPVEPEPIDAIREAEILDEALDEVDEDDPMIEEE